MDDYQPLLLRIPLFANIKPQELPHLLQCLKAKPITIGKNNFVLREGDPADHIGIVLSGRVEVIRDDYYGRRSLLAELGVGDLFAETFACANLATMPVSVLATQPSTILLLNYKNIITACPTACPYHTHLIQNMLSILAKKALVLNRKVRHLSYRTTREKVLSFLSEQAVTSGAHTFTIRFNRQQLADYLGVDRSALSAELSRMQKEGLLSYHRSEFTLHQTP